MNLRKILLLAALFILAGSATVAHTCLMAQEPPISKSDRIFEDPDIIPMFTGGSGEMNRFIFNTLKYPPEAVERNAQGLVVYTFVVEKDGTLSNFNIIHRADSLLNKEALRILEAMPPWRPARHRGGRLCGLKHMFPCISG